MFGVGGVHSLGGGGDEGAGVAPLGHTVDDPHSAASHHVGDLRVGVMVRRAERVWRNQGQPEADDIASEWGVRADDVGHGSPPGRTG